MRGNAATPRMPQAGRALCLARAGSPVVLGGVGSVVVQ
jgi:hypothetical protein